MASSDLTSVQPSQTSAETRIRNEKIFREANERAGERIIAFTEWFAENVGDPAAAGVGDGIAKSE